MLFEGLLVIVIYGEGFGERKVKKSKSRTLRGLC